MLQHMYTTVPTQGCRQVRQRQEHPGQRQGLHGQGAGGGLGHHTPALHEVLSSLREVTDTVGQSVVFRMDFYECSVKCAVFRGQCAIIILNFK